MNNASLAPVTEGVAELESLYGTFDIDLCGLPTQGWQNRNLKRFKAPEMLQHAFFPQVYIARVLVNRRMLGPIERVYQEIVTRWPIEARKAYGLNQFVKCYCFGDGSGPNLFWYGAAWELSPLVNGEILGEVATIFRRHGFTHAYGSDKKLRARIFEYW
jgi:hypothetical protein